MTPDLRSPRSPQHGEGHDLVVQGQAPQGLGCHPHPVPAAPVSGQVTHTDSHPPPCCHGQCQRQLHNPETCPVPGPPPSLQDEGQGLRGSWTGWQDPWYGVWPRSEVRKGPPATAPSTGSTASAPGALATCPHPHALWEVASDRQAPPLSFLDPPGRPTCRGENRSRGRDVTGTSPSDPGPRCLPSPSQTAPGAPGDREQTAELTQNQLRHGGPDPQVPTGA